MLRVRPHQVGRARQVLVDLLAQHLPQQRHQAMPDPGAQVHGVAVHGVLPEVHVEQAADLFGVRPAQCGGLVATAAQERPQQQAAPTGNACQRPGAGAASQGHQHLLGLVVQSVPQQQGQGAPFLREPFESVVTSVPSGVLQATGGVVRNLDAQHMGGGPQSLDLGAGALGDPCGGLLQAVVDDPGLRLQAHAGGHPGSGGQQRQGVRSPADAHQQAGRVAAGGVVGELLETGGEAHAHGRAGTGDHGRRAGHQSSCTSSAATASTAALASRALDPSNPCTTIE